MPTAVDVLVSGIDQKIANLNELKQNLLSMAKELDTGGLPAVTGRLESFQPAADPPRKTRKRRRPGRTPKGVMPVRASILIQLSKKPMRQKEMEGPAQEMGVVSKAKKFTNVFYQGLHKAGVDGLIQLDDEGYYHITDEGKVYLKERYAQHLHQ